MSDRDPWTEARIGSLDSQVSEIKKTQLAAMDRLEDVYNLLRGRGEKAGIVARIALVEAMAENNATRAENNRLKIDALRQQFLIWMVVGLVLTFLIIGVMTIFLMWVNGLTVV